MLESLRRRGSDGGAVETPAPGVLLGDTRLAIVDLSTAAAQPIRNEILDVWAVVNGEIYNHLELRTALEKAGHRFRSHCDSEVVVHAYEEWGDGMLARLRGIFALAVFDGRTKRLLLARDAAGVKPLYMWRRRNALYFASELKALRCLPGFSSGVDDTAMWAYLAHRYVPDTRTIHPGVEKLPAGWMAVWQNSRASTSRHWGAQLLAEPPDHAEAEHQLSALAEDCVSTQLMSDVPIGLLLSGGVDSSALAAIARRRGSIVEAFCCGFAEESHDERRFARTTARAYGLRLHEIEMSWAGLERALPEFVEWFDEPFFDYSAVAVH